MSSQAMQGELIADEPKPRPARKAVTVQNEHAPPAPVTEASAILSLIERAAMNPAVDIDKMERLFEMQKQAQARASQADYDHALAQMQPDLPVIDEHGKISTDKGKTVQSTYALWEDINEAIKPVLAKHGFGLTFRVKNAPGVVSVTGILAGHGHREETTLDLPVDGSGSKNGVQAVASSTSYGQRYTAKLLLNLTSRGVDDDGQAAGAGDLISEDQVADLVALMDEVNADRTRFLNHLRVDTLAHLPAKRFSEAVKALEAKRRAQ